MCENTYMKIIPQLILLLQDTPKDETGEIDVNPQSIIEKLDTWLDGFIKALPNILVGIAVFVIMLYLGRWIGKLVKRGLKNKGRRNFGDLLGAFTRYLITIAGIALALTIMAPNLSPADYEKLEQTLQAGDESIESEDPKAWLDADEKLHSYIIQKSENSVLAELLDNIRNRINIFRILTAQLPSRAKRAQNEHRSVVTAMKKQKNEEAEALVAKHIKNTYEVGINA